MLRPYRKEDISKIVTLERENLESSLEESFYIQDLTNPLARHYVWEETGKSIGFISSVFDGFSLEILNFVVDKAYQSKGYGTKLFAAFLDELIPLGLNHVSLEVRESNQRAIAFYHKFGFKTIGVRAKYYANLENALVMQKMIDDKKDMIELEAILFSKKQGRKYTSDFKERYCLNYYDLYDYPVTSLNQFPFEEYGLFLTNWLDEQLFQDFDISSCALLHVNAYNFHSLVQKKYEIQENYLFDFREYAYQANVEYGEEYALKYAEFCIQQIQLGKMKLLSVIKETETVGSVKILEYHHSIFIMGLYVMPIYRKQGIAASLMEECIQYAKRIGKCEVYLEAEPDDTPIQMYERMNFKVIDTYYEMLKVNEWKKQM